MIWEQVLVCGDGGEVTFMVKVSEDRIVMVTG